MKLYRISKWREVFEQRGDAKRLQHGMSWVSLPACLTSRGRLRLLRQGVEGIVALAVFEGLVQAHASLPAARRTGELVHSDGNPMDADDLAEIIRIPADHVRRSLDLLSEPSVGWLQTAAEGEVPLKTVGEPSGSHPESSGQLPEAVRKLPDDGRKTPANVLPTGQDRTRQRGKRASAREAPPASPQAAGENQKPEEPQPTASPPARCGFDPLELFQARHQAVVRAPYVPGIWAARDAVELEASLAATAVTEAEASAVFDHFLRTAKSSKRGFGEIARGFGEVAAPVLAALRRPQTGTAPEPEVRPRIDEREPVCPAVQAQLDGFLRRTRPAMGDSPPEASNPAAAPNPTSVAARLPPEEFERRRAAVLDALRGGPHA